MIAFGIASAIAALGGIALSFNTITVVYNQGFDPFTSISAVGYTFIGGIGYIFGSAIGGQLAPNGLGTEISNLLPRDGGKVPVPGGRHPADCDGSCQPGRHRTANGSSVRLVRAEDPPGSGAGWSRRSAPRPC